MKVTFVFTKRQITLSEYIWLLVITVWVCFFFFFLFHGSNCPSWSFAEVHLLACIFF